MLDPRTERRQRARNLAQGAVLLACLVLAGTALVWLLSGPVGVVVVLLLAGVAGAVRRRVPAGAQMALYGARPLPPSVAPGLYLALRELARRAGLPRVPRLYRVAGPLPNALSAGRGEDTALAVTDGLLDDLPDREVVGVLAHEVSHLRAGDSTAMTLADGVGRLARILAWLGLVALAVGVPLSVAGRSRLPVVGAVLVGLPLLVTALELAFARSREFDADRGAAQLTGDPEGLALALEDLDRVTGFWEDVLLPRRPGRGAVLLRTHPATAERVRRLRALEPSPDPAGPGARP